MPINNFQWGVILTEAVIGVQFDKYFPTIMKDINHNLPTHRQLSKTLSRFARVFFRNLA